MFAACKGAFFNVADKARDPKRRGYEAKKQDCELPLNDPLCAYVDTVPFSHLLSSLSLYLKWLCSSEAFEARQKQPSHRQDKLRAGWNQIWSCAIVREARLCCSYLCPCNDSAWTLWYADGHSNKMPGSLWILNQAFHYFIFLMFFFSGRDGVVDQADALTSSQSLITRGLGGEDSSISKCIKVKTRSGRLMN